MSNRLWLQALLVVSLAFNLAVVIGHLIGSPAPHEAHGPEAFEERIVHPMSPSDAAIVHRAFANHATEFAAHRRDVDGAIGNVRTVLTRDPFDWDELKAAMEKAAVARAASEQVMQQTLLDCAKVLSPAGRKLLLPDPPHGAHPPVPDVSPPPPPDR